MGEHLELREVLKEKTATGKKTLGACLSSV